MQKLIAANAFMKKIALLFLLSICLLGCPKHFSGEPVELDYSSTGKTISLYPSQNIIVDLIEDSSEGKVWGISPYTTNVIGFISSRFEPDEKIPGAGGHRIIQFKALNYGTSPLKIQYYNTSTKHVKPTKTFEVTINVKKPKS